MFPPSELHQGGEERYRGHDKQRAFIYGTSSVLVGTSLAEFTKKMRSNIVVVLIVKNCVRPYGPSKYVMNITNSAPELSFVGVLNSHWHLRRVVVSSEQLGNPPGSSRSDIYCR